MTSLQSLAQQHRAAILARERQTNAHIETAYQHLRSQVFAALQRLFTEMRQTTDSGQQITLAWLYQAHRLQHLHAALTDPSRAFAATAQSKVQAARKQALVFGQQDAQKLLRHALPGIDLQFGSPMQQAIDILANRGASSAYIASLFAKMDRQTLLTVRKWLLLDIARGVGPREIALDIQRALGKSLSSALTIARTETMQAYRDGTLSIYRANSDVVKGWEWLASPGACDFCESMNGQHFDLGTPLDSHPNCRCTQLPDTASYEDILAA